MADKKTKLTHEDMVQIIKDGGSVMVGEEFITDVNKLPVEEVPPAPPADPAKAATAAVPKA